MITEYKDICAVCGNRASEIHHMVFGRGIRPLADEDKLVIPLCNECHSTIHQVGVCGALSKMLGQMQWESEHPELGREGFRKRYGRSWL